MKKLYCSTIVALFLTALSVFLGELAKTEYKSQMTKRKLRKQLKQTEIAKRDQSELVNVDYTQTSTQENIEYV